MPVDLLEVPLVLHCPVDAEVTGGQGVGARARELRLMPQAGHRPDERQGCQACEVCLASR